MDVAQSSPKRSNFGCSHNPATLRFDYPSEMNENQIREDLMRRLKELASQPAPQPTPALAEFLADPSSSLTEQGDLAAMSASNVNGSALTQAAGLPKGKRMKNRTVRLRSGLARMGFAGRVVLVSAVVVAAGAGTAAAATAVNAVVNDEPPITVDVTDDGQGDGVVDPVDVAGDQGDDAGDNAGGEGNQDD